jgi:thiamine transporter ThiT
MSETRTIFRTRMLAEIVVFVAASTALSYVKVFSLPQGGSVTAGSMVPVLWLSLRRGPVTGIFACTLYGIVQLVVDPFVYHPVQVLLDYPIAFGALGLAGFFQRRPFLRRATPVAFDRLFALLFCAGSFTLLGYSLTRLRLSETVFFAWIFAFSFIFLLLVESRKRIEEIEGERRHITPALVGVTIGILGRFVAHFISGVVFFGPYAPEGMNPIVYAAIYNGAYIVPELCVSAYLIYLLVRSGMIGIYK